MLYKTNIIKDNINKFSNPKFSYWLICFVVFFNFIYLDVIWTNDSFVFISTDIQHLIPQHAILYPLLIHFVDKIVSSDLQLVYTVKILQNGLFLFSVLYLLKNVQSKIKIGLLVCSFFIFFIVQNGIYTEGFYVSFMLMFLTTLLKLYRDRKFLIFDYLILIFSFLGLTLIRHTGILFFMLPMLMFIEYSRYSFKLITSVTILLFSVLFISISMTNYVKNNFYSMDISMFGRPAMHIIEKTFKNNSNRKVLIADKWMSKATNEDQLVAQNFILEEISGGIWFQPRLKISQYLKNKYTELESSEVEMKTEQLINQAYINFVKTADIGLLKQYSITAGLLMSVFPFSSYSLIEDDIKVKNGDFFDTYGIQQMGWLDFKSNKFSYFIIGIFILLQIIAGIYVMKEIIKSIKEKKVNTFGIILLSFYFIQIAVHAISTVYIARYTVTFICIILIFLISLIETRSIENN